MMRKKHTRQSAVIFALPIVPEASLPP